MIQQPPLPKNEVERLSALRSLCLLDTPSDPALDMMTALAASTFDLPIALVSLVDEGRQWFKSKVGLEVRETPRSQAFCAYALLSTEPMVVLDTLQDERFVDNPLVTGAPYLRFYAGVPLITSAGICLGTFCVMGPEPRTGFGSAQRDQLQHFARLAMMRMETVRNIGFVDALTRLPNRVRFQEDISLWMKELPEAPRQLYAVAIDVCGISYFQRMRTAFGSEYADGFLKAAAGRIAEALTPAPVYRVDSTVLACTLEADDDAGLSAQLAAMHGKFSRMIEHRDIPHAPQVVIGAVSLATQANTVDTTRALGSALNHARSQRIASAIYHSALDVAQQRAFRILAAIPEALASDGQLHLHYQPRLDMADGACLGVEALLRWTHPELGVVSPAEFIPLAEKTALIRDITAWVLNAALAQAERWQAAGHRFSVSINVSAVDLDGGAFVDSLTSVLARHQVDPAMIEIEFTESAMSTHPLSVGEQLRRVRALGLQIAIDDFGAGYSGLTYLKQIPATTLKIDQSFVRALPADPDDVTIICAIISLGHSFGHRVVAEGIETAQVYRLLRSWGCDEGQGYWIAKPMACDDLLEWLSSYTPPLPWPAESRIHAGE